MVPKRNLFGFSRSKPATPPKSAAESSHEILSQLNNQLSQGIRPTPPGEVLEALNAFFEEKDARSVALEELEVLQAQKAFEYLRKASTEEDDFGLSKINLRTALKALAYEPKAGHSHTRYQFAEQLYGELKFQAGLVPGPKEVDSNVEYDSDFARGVAAYIRILSQSGHAREARELVINYWESSLKQRPDRNRPWYDVLRGFVNEADAAEVTNTVDTLGQHNMSFDVDIQRVIVTAYARKGDAEAVKRWYDHPIVDSTTPRSATDAAVLEMFIRQGEYEWGEKVFRSILERQTPHKKSWCLILKWSAAKGKGVDEIERMMTVMMKRNEGIHSDSQVVPDIEVINELVELANSRNDPYTAERYVALGQRWGMQPDARTYLLQMDYRLKIGDLDGARAAFARLQSEDVSDNQDIPFTNKLIVALCEKNQPYNTIMSIVEELNERKIRFEPPTVAALARLHFRRNEIEHVDGLLSSHIADYSFDQRASIQAVLISFINDRANPTALAWEAYRILCTRFPWTSSAARTRLMTEFYARKRPDLGTYAFGQMRQSPHSNLRPSALTYKACLEGIARAGGDSESLHLIHNMLKLDTTIDPSTRLSNGLMLAYTACGNPDRALEFWDDIVHSKEGPTYNSIQIALQACEVAPFGEETARSIWSRLQRFGIKVTREIYAAYVGALAGQAKFQECVDLVDKMVGEIGEEPTTLV